jgi:hypothetical protein
MHYFRKEIKMLKKAQDIVFGADEESTRCVSL